MENRLNNTIRNIQTSGIRQFNQMASQIEGCIKFTLGEPDFNTPAPIKAALRKAVQQDYSHYSQNAGVPAFRKAICDDVYLRYGFTYEEDEVCVSVGASEALTSALQTILNPNDEVIVFEPAYPAYKPLIELNHAVYKGIDTTSSNFQINHAHLEEVINERTKAIILTSPNNPTGYAYNKESLDAVYKCCKNREIFIICDYIYDEITYESIPSFLSYHDMKDRIIFIQSFSKAYAMAGYRLGYVCAEQNIMKHIIKTHSYFISCAPTTIQMAGLAALKVDTTKMVLEYKNRRDYAIACFAKMGIHIPAPQGAFYLFVDISKYNMNSYDFSYDLLQKHKVCVVPGRYFSSHCDNYIRISYACSMKDLKEGLQRIANYILEIQK